MARGPGSRGPQVRAAVSAGGVVYRVRDGRVEIVLVARPVTNLWALPKGTPEAGESIEQTAVREVAEETGLSVELGADLGEVRYTDHRGRPKVVRYWAMTVASGEATGDGDEVDELAWLSPKAARSRLTYPPDRPLLDRLGAAPQAGSVKRTV